MPGRLSAFTPELSDSIRTVLDAVMIDMYVAMPAKVVSYDADLQYADVQIQLLQQYDSGASRTYPVIPNVPVKQIRANGGKIFIHVPLQPGDDVILMFSQRSLDNWKSQGGLTDPDDPRKFHITDAFALIGGSAMPDAFTPTTTDSIEIVNEDSQVVVHPDGTYNLFGGNDDDLVQVINDFVLGVQRASTLTLIGPMPLVDPLDPGWLILQERTQSFTNGSDPYEGI